MPYKTYNAFNAQGTPAAYSDMEKVDIQRGLAGADNAFKQAMLNMQGRQLDQQGNQFNAGLIAQDRLQSNALAAQRDISGSFGDRTAAQRDLMGLQQGGAEKLARIGQEVPLAELGFRNQAYQDGRSDGEIDRNIARKKGEFQMGLLDRGFAKAMGGAGATGAGMDPGLEEELMRKALDLGENPDKMFKRSMLERAVPEMAKIAATDPNPARRNKASQWLSANGFESFAAANGTMAPDSSVASDEFTALPEVQQEIEAIGAALAQAGNDTNAESLAAALKPRVDRLVAKATAQGADPNQVLQVIKETLSRSASASTLYTNPITTTLGAIPGVRNLVPEPSRDAARRGIGL